jgi:hypothetical protein
MARRRVRILAIHNVGKNGPTEGPPVHIWRIWRPLRELAKHVDWEIEHSHYLVESLEGDPNKAEFTEQELLVAAQRLSQYDIVFLSYSILSAAAYVFMCAVTNRYGTQFVIDCDDDLFAVNEMNPIWLSVSRERMWDLQTILRDNPWVTTTTERLARVLRDRRPVHAHSSVMIAPNYITNDYKHPPIEHPDKVVVGYFGGSSHWNDLNDIGFPKAMRDIMRKHKHVHFRAAGVPLNTTMPSRRESFIDPARGLEWVTDAYPTLDMDIAVGPLENNVFNWGKSNIKWQEATRAGAAFIASNIGPYFDLPAGVVYKVNQTRAEWFDALEMLVLDATERRAMLTRARTELAANWRLEDHWRVYQELFEHVLANKVDVVV